MGIRLFSFGLLLILLSYNEAAMFKFTNVVCESWNRSWVSVDECRLRAVSRNKTTLTMMASLLHPVNEVLINAQVFKRANGYRPWLYKGQFDACRFMRKAYIPLVIFIFSLIKDYTNLNHPCPYVGQVYMKDMFVQMDNIPHTMPTGDYMLKMEWILHKKPTGISKVYGTFTEDIMEQ